MQRKAEKFGFFSRSIESENLGDKLGDRPSGKHTMFLTVELSEVHLDLYLNTPTDLLEDGRDLL